MLVEFGLKYISLLHTDSTPQSFAAFEDNQCGH